MNLTVDRTTVLEDAFKRLESDPNTAGETIALLASQLRDIKQSQSVSDWKQTIDIARAHPLRALVHQDPLTRRAFTKPRGYQGDAGLLDIIYRKRYADLNGDAVSQVGGAIFDYTIDCQAPAAVRERKDYLMARIDQAATDVDRPHVLSVACGHLRELQACDALRQQRIGRFIGLDQDPLSLQLIQNELGTHGIETIEGSIKLLLGGALTRERFDFIYAAGLYDYLEDRIAGRLTEKMFSMLKPGGRLLIANYLPGIPDVGYMETYMGWELIYRTGDQLQELTNGIPANEIADRTLRNDAHNNIVYLEARRM